MTSKRPQEKIKELEERIKKLEEQIQQKADKSHSHPHYIPLGDRIIK
jgi:cell division septum initiation protein DivIVA